MASSRYHRSRAKSADIDNVVFIFIILAAAACWQHKALVLQIEHIVIYGFIAITTIILIVYAIKLKGRLSRFRFRDNLTMLDIDKMDGLEFERYLVKILDQLGYGAIRLTETYDYGVDIIAVKNGVTWGIQAKRYNGLVKADAVRQAVTALKKYHCDRAMVITNSYYSKVAKELANCNDCTLIDRDTLRHWVI
jgi:HJR/Mrr/RecB family endonuclease